MAEPFSQQTKHERDVKKNEIFLMRRKKLGKSSPQAKKGYRKVSFAEKLKLKILR